jgi:hypothetical protein
LQLARDQYRTVRKQISTLSWQRQALGASQ